MQSSEFKTQIKKFLNRRENKIYLGGITFLTMILVLSYNLTGSNLTGSLAGLSSRTATVSSPQISAPAISTPAPQVSGNQAIMPQLPKSPISPQQSLGVSGENNMNADNVGQQQFSPVKNPAIGNIVISQGEKIVTITYTLSDSSGKANLEAKILTTDDLEIKKWDSLTNQASGMNTLTWDSPIKGNYIFSIGGIDESKIIARQTKDFSVVGPAASLTCELDNKEVKPGDTVTWKASLNDASDSNTIYSWSGDGGTGKGPNLESKYSSEITISNEKVTASDPNLYGTLSADCPTLTVKADAPSDESAENNALDCTIDESCKAAADVISCTLTHSTTALDNTEKASLSCSVKPTAYVTALVVKGDFDPSQYSSPSEIEPKYLVRKLKNNEPYKDNGEMDPNPSFSLSFEGKDKFDTQVEAGDYTFLVYARPDSNHKYDISKKTFNVIEEGVAGPAQKLAKDQLKGSAPESSLSKCGTKYPKDIKNHWAEAVIKTAYDLCIVSGFPNQTFKPNTKITRVDAVVIGLKTFGIKPVNCIDAECGTGFLDLNDKVSSGYINVAKKLGIIKGYNPRTFGPNRNLTRAEAVALIAKLAYAVKLTPEPFYKGCYNAHCGAGFPNIFYDITNIATGSYLKEILSLDPNIIVGGPNTFRPNDLITRAEITKIFIKLREFKVK